MLLVNSTASSMVT